VALLQMQIQLLAGARMEPLLHNVPPEENESHDANVRRRIEITVEREVLSVVWQPASSADANPADATYCC
jgi:hypothetical protein